MRYPWIESYLYEIAIQPFGEWRVTLPNRVTPHSPKGHHNSLNTQHLCIQLATTK